MKVAIHCHSLMSDGELTCEEILQIAKNEGAFVCAITDHDIISIPKDAEGIKYLPSAEFTADDFTNFHILGYNIQNPQYVKVLYTYLNNLNDEKMRLIIKKLRDINIDISYEDVKKFADGKAINKVIIKKYLVLKRYVPSTHEAYNVYMGKNRPAYVKVRDFNATFLINLIKACGGVPVLAHPTKINCNGKDITTQQLDEILGKLKKLGLVGIEVYNAKMDIKYNETIIELCKKYDLIPMVGSDFHNSNTILTIDMDNNQLKRFIDAVNEAKNNYSLDKIKKFHNYYARSLLDIPNKTVKEDVINETEFNM